MSILNKFLSKRGIKDPKELSQEEQQVYDNWRKILSKDELTLKDIKEFCKTQTEIIEQKWRDYNLEQNKKGELIPYHSVYKTILLAIDSPKIAREALEKQLIEMIK